MIYKVLVTRDVTESATFRVLASSQEEASSVALLVAQRGPPYEIVEGYNPVWERDDCQGGEPYLADPEEAVQPLDDPLCCAYCGEPTVQGDCGDPLCEANTNPN